VVDTAVQRDVDTEGQESQHVLLSRYRRSACYLPQRYEADQPSAYSTIAAQTPKPREGLSRIVLSAERIKLGVGPHAAHISEAIGHAEKR